MNQNVHKKTRIVEMPTILNVRPDESFSAYAGEFPGVPASGDNYVRADINELLNNTTRREATCREKSKSR